MLLLIFNLLPSRWAYSGLVEPLFLDIPYHYFCISDLAGDWSSIIDLTSSNPSLTLSAGRSGCDKRHLNKVCRRELSLSAITKPNLRIRFTSATLMELENAGAYPKAYSQTITTAVRTRSFPIPQLSMYQHVDPTQMTGLS